jgi:hypothetical protein
LQLSSTAASEVPGRRIERLVEDHVVRRQRADREVAAQPVIAQEDGVEALRLGPLAEDPQIGKGVGDEDRMDVRVCLPPLLRRPSGRGVSTGACQDREEEQPEQREP